MVKAWSSEAGQSDSNGEWCLHNCINQTLQEKNFETLTFWNFETLALQLYGSAVNPANILQKGVKYV